MLVVSMNVPTKHEENSMSAVGVGVGERDGRSGDVVSEEGKGEQKMEVRRYARKKPPPMQRLIIHDRMEDSGCHSDSQGEGSGRRSSSSPRSNTSSPRHHRRHRSGDSDNMLEEKCSGREKNSRMSLQALIHLHRLEDSDRTDSNDEGVNSRRSSRRSHSSPRNHQSGDNNNSDIISRFLDDNITNSESDGGSAPSSRTPRHHRHRHHHSRSTHEDHSPCSRDHSCDRNLNESSPPSSRSSRGDIISRFLDDNITNSESDGGGASSSRTPRHHRHRHHHSRSTHEDHSPCSRDHSCDRKLNESSPRSSRSSRGDRHRRHASNHRHHHVDKSSSNEELADEVDDIVISEVEDQKTMQQLFDVFINDETKDTTEEMRAAAKYSILSLMKSSTNFESFIDSFTLSIANLLAVDYRNDTQIAASLDLLELLVGPSKSFVFPPDNDDDDALLDNFLELLAPSLGKFFECVVGIFTHLHECPYEKKASALRILTHLITYSGKQASRIYSCLEEHKVAVTVAENLQNDTDEILIKYEMIANSDMFSADTFFDFACKVKQYNALYRLFGAFDARLNKVLLSSRNSELPPSSVALDDSENEIESENPTNTNKHNFISCYEESKTQFLYILSIMANNLGLYTDLTTLNNILQQLLEGAQHGNFLDRIEFLRVVCHLGGGESVFKTLILESSIVETVTYFLKNCCTSHHARTVEVMWHLNVLCANVACRNVLFWSGLIPEIVEKMKVVGKRVSHLSNLKILLPLVSSVAKWDCSDYSELLSHLLEVIFDKSHDGRVRIVYKELFLVLGHGVGESVTLHKAFVTANCKYPQETYTELYILKKSVLIFFI